MGNVIAVALMGNAHGHPGIGLATAKMYKEFPKFAHFSISNSIRIIDPIDSRFVVGDRFWVY